MSNLLEETKKKALIHIKMSNDSHINEYNLILEHKHIQCPSIARYYLNTNERVISDKTKRSVYIRQETGDIHKKVYKPVK
jgi:hypothetical protein